MKCGTKWHERSTCEGNMEETVDVTGGYAAGGWLQTHRRQCPKCDEICEREEETVNSIRCGPVLDGSHYYGVLMKFLKNGKTSKMDFQLYTRLPNKTRLNI